MFIEIIQLKLYAVNVKMLRIFFHIIILNPMWFMCYVIILLLRCILSLLRAILKLYTHHRRIWKHAFRESKRAENQFYHCHFHSISFTCLANNVEKEITDRVETMETSAWRRWGNMALWYRSRSVDTFCSAEWWRPVTRDRASKQSRSYSGLMDRSSSVVDGGQRHWGAQQEITNSFPRAHVHISPSLWNLLLNWGLAARLVSRVIRTLTMTDEVLFC